MNLFSFNLANLTTKVVKLFLGRYLRSFIFLYYPFDFNLNNPKKIFKRYPKSYRKRFLTITSDNGSEFMNAQVVEEVGVTYFYSHSYCSLEIGSNKKID